MPETLLIRTQDPLDVLIKSHATGIWRIDREHLAQCRRIKIYNWDRTEYIAGEIDHKRVINPIFIPDKVVIAFKPDQRYPISCVPIEWEGQNCIRYVELSEQLD